MPATTRFETVIDCPVFIFHIRLPLPVSVSVSPPNTTWFTDEFSGERIMRLST